MTNFVLVYHGGGMPATEEEGQRLLATWGAWLGGLGSSLVDGGNPVSQVRTVASDGSVSDGAPNPVTGYSVITAESIDDAVAHAKSCPILASGGSVEVGETFNVM